MPDTEPLLNALTALNMRQRAALIHAWGTQAEQLLDAGLRAECELLTSLVMLVAELEVELHEQFVDFAAGHDDPPPDQH